MINAWKPDIVIYHHPCADGFAAAWACHTRWPEAEYVPAKYGDAPPDVTGKRVLIVDFSFKEPVLRAMGERALSVVVLDHHKTAMADLEAFQIEGQWDTKDLGNFRAAVEHYESHPAFPHNIFAFFDMTRSGARLAWEFARPAASVPPLVMYVEDRDLWRFYLPDSRAISAWLRTMPFEFERWSMANDALTASFETCVQQGRPMLAYYDVLVAGIVETAAPLELITEEATYTVPTVNCPAMFASDVGNALLKANPAAPFALTFSEALDGTRYWSARSEPRRVDVSEIARQMGGGGHRDAAGFSQKIAPVIL